jgi:hypothetical protein
MKQTAAEIELGYPVAMLGSIVTGMAGLPAEPRAQVQWHSNQLSQNLERLHTGELTADLIMAVTTECWKSMTSTGAAILEPVQGQEEAFVQSMSDAYGKEMARLRDYVDATSADAAEWALHGVMRFYSDVLHHVSRNQKGDQELQESAGDAEFETALRSRVAGLFRAQILLLAAFEGVNEEIATERVRELACRAFEHACEGIDALRERGVRLNPLDDEPVESRVARTLRYAAELRGALSEDDVAILEAARMGDLQ